jgi:hypothetical protein
MANASAQLSEETAQKLINDRVKNDCGKGFKVACYLWTAPLISLKGKSWVWGGIHIYECPFVCLPFPKIHACEHKGSLGPTLVMKAHKHCGPWQRHKNAVSSRLNRSHSAVAVSQRRHRARRRLIRRE